jgi:hypothetical protein
LMQIEIVHSFDSAPIDFDFHKHQCVAANKQGEKIR